MALRRLLTTTTAALAIVLLLAGCTGEDEEPLTTLTPVERTVQTNPDRDASRVAEKAAAIDPCALLTAADPRRSGDFPRASSPRACTMVMSQTSVTVLTELSEGQRFRLAPEELRGVAAYRTELEQGGCLIQLPISHDQAITFDSGHARCDNARRHAEAAVGLLLQDPARAARPRGVQRVSACQLVEQAGFVPERHQSRTPEESAFDQCDVEDSPIDLRLVYDDTVVRDYQKAHQVAGTTVRTQQAGNRCYLHWPLAPADTAVRDGYVLSARVTTTKCGEGLAFAKELIPATKKVRSSDLAPTDLLYASGEADTSAVGACADIEQQAELECSPAEEAEVPGDRRELIMAAEADPNVLCAATTPVVRDHYGDSFTPVTTLAPPHALAGTGAGGRDVATQCVFGSRDHTFEVSIALSTAEANVPAGDNIAGHPAHVEITHLTPSAATRSYVVARDDVDEPGFLTVELQAWPERGTGVHRISGQQVKPDLARMDRAHDLVTDLTHALL